MRKLSSSNFGEVLIPSAIKTSVDSNENASEVISKRISLRWSKQNLEYKALIPIENTPRRGE